MSYTPNKNTLARGIFEPVGSGIGSGSGQIGDTLRSINGSLFQRVFYTATGSGETAAHPSWSSEHFSSLNLSSTSSLLDLINKVTGSRGYEGITRENSRGYAQLLFLDIYPAYGFNNGLFSINGKYNVIGDPSASAPIAFHIHGGGFDAGAANFESSAEETCNTFRRAGFHCISLEYRRGWTTVSDVTMAGLLNENPRALGFSDSLLVDKLTISGSKPPLLGSEYNDRFLQTALGGNSFAIGDLADAWDWVDKNIQTVLPNAIKKYMIQGQSAGGSATAQLTYAHDGTNPIITRLQSKVIGSIVSYGSYTASADLNTTIQNREINYPIIIQANGVDKLVPYRDNYLYFQPNIAISKGCWDQYEMLSGSNKNVYFYSTLLTNHGYGNWAKNFTFSGSSPYSEIEYLNWAFNVIIKKLNGESMPPSHWLVRVDNREPEITLSSSFFYPGPGYYTDLVNDSDIYALYNTSSMFKDLPFNKGITTHWFYSSSAGSTQAANSLGTAISRSFLGTSVEYEISKSAEYKASIISGLGSLVADAILQSNLESYIAATDSYSSLHWGKLGNAPSNDLRTLDQISSSISSSLADGTASADLT